MALSEATREAKFLRTLLEQLDKLDTNQPIIIHSDNMGAIALTDNPAHHRRTKHIDARHHFIREAVEQGTVAIKHLRTNDMPADIFTKSLGGDKFEKFRRMMGCVDVLVETWKHSS